jgi:hypothetical protein
MAKQDLSVIKEAYDEDMANNKGRSKHIKLTKATLEEREKEAYAANAEAVTQLINASKDVKDTELEIKQEEKDIKLMESGGGRTIDKLNAQRAARDARQAKRAETDQARRGIKQATMNANSASLANTRKDNNKDVTRADANFA